MRTVSESRRVMRAALRQLDRADVYLAAVAFMPVDDGELDRAIRKLRADLAAVRSYLVSSRSALEG